MASKKVILLVTAQKDWLKQYKEVSMVIPSYRSKFHPAVSWVVLLPPEEEFSAPPVLLVTACAEKCQQTLSKASNVGVSAMVLWIVPKRLGRSGGL